MHILRIALVFLAAFAYQACTTVESLDSSVRSNNQSTASTALTPRDADSDAEQTGLEDLEQIFENMKVESEKRGFFSTELVHCASKDSKLTVWARVYAGPRGSKLLTLKGAGRKMRELYEFNASIKAVATISSEKLLLKPSERFDPESQEVEIPNVTRINSFRLKLSDSVFLSTGDYPEIKVARVAINEIVYSPNRRKGNVRIVFEPPESGPVFWRFFVGCTFDSRLYHLKRALGNDPLKEFKETEESTKKKPQ